MSPDGAYFAVLIKNGGDEGLLAVTWNNDTQESSIAVYDQGSRNVTIQLKKNDSQELTLSCSLQ